MENPVLAAIIQYVGLPGLVFIARVIDVTLGTLRIIFISRGKKYIAPILGFVETFIWIMAIGQIVRNINDPWSYVAYAAGFASGTVVGMLIEDRLAIGTLIIRTILPGDTHELIERLHNAGYGVTCVPGEGVFGPVTLVYTVIKRKDLQVVTAIIHALHPKAFLSIEEVRSTAEGIFPKNDLRKRLSLILSKK